MGIRNHFYSRSIIQSDMLFFKKYGILKKYMLYFLK